MQMSHVGRFGLSLQKKQNETKDKETHPSTLPPLLQIPKWQLQSLDQNTVRWKVKGRSDGQIL